MYIDITECKASPLKIQRIAFEAKRHAMIEAQAETI